MASMASTMKPLYDKLPSGSRARQAIGQGTVKGGGPETVDSIMRGQGQPQAKKRPMLMDGKKPEKPATGGDETIGSSGKSLGN